LVYKCDAIEEREGAGKRWPRERAAALCTWMQPSRESFRDFW
jgi:hypothetical protein